MKILGLDPGSHRTGFGIMKVVGGKEDVLEYGTYERQAVENEKALASLLSWTILMLEKWNPDVVGMEAVFFGRNTQNAIRTAEARGVLMAAIGRWGRKCGVFHFTPSQVKKAATGSGTAEKKDVKRFLEARFGMTLEGHDDGHDGLALAVSCIPYLKGLAAS